MHTYQFSVTVKSVILFHKCQTVRNKNHLNKTINYLCKQIFLSIVITGRFQSAKLINTFRNIVFHYLKRCYFSCLFVLRNYNKSRVYLVEQFLKDMPDQCFHLEVSSYFREENATTYQSH